MTKSNKRIFLREWEQSVVGWIILVYFYFFISIWGLSKQIDDPVILNYIFSWRAQLEILLTAVSFGTLFTLVNAIVDRSAIRRQSFGLIILIKSILYILSMSIVFFLVLAVFNLFDLMGGEEYHRLIGMFDFFYMASIIVYYIFGILLLNFILQVDKKFGPGILLKLLLGKYHKPKQENHIFLFLDLNDSTTIAEELGDIRYSQLIAACFHDITEVVIQYRAEIYQYVGDEVVLCWNIDQGLKNLNCIRAFFAFEGQLKSHWAYYMKQFGLIPQFKGGMDMGMVTLAEVGDIKRDIAYHGDVLNTAARIQGLCKARGRKLLVSGHLHDRIRNDIPKDLEMEEMGSEVLRGKTEKTDIYAIQSRLE